MEKIDPPILVNYRDGRPSAYGYAMDEKFLYLRDVDGNESKMRLDEPAQLMKRPLAERN